MLYILFATNDDDVLLFISFELLLLLLFTELLVALFVVVLEKFDELFEKLLTAAGADCKLRSDCLLSSCDD